MPIPVELSDLIAVLKLDEAILNGINCPIRLKNILISLFPGDFTEDISGKLWLTKHYKASAIAMESDKIRFDNLRRLRCLKREATESLAKQLVSKLHLKEDDALPLADSLITQKKIGALVNLGIKLGDEYKEIL